MPVAPTYPGVYIEEIPSGVRTIVGVATSITAFVGSAYGGPTDKPVSVNGMADYERIFGSVSPAYPMSYAVRDFFVNGGSQALIIRLYHEDPSGTPPARTTVDVGGLKLDAAAPGPWGENLRATVSKEVDKDLAAAMNVPVDQLFHLTVRDASPGGRVEQYRNITLADHARRIDRVLKAESDLVRWGGGAPDPGTAVQGGSDPVTTAEEKLTAAKNAVPRDTAAIDEAKKAVEDAKAAFKASPGLALTQADDFTPPNGEASKEGIFALENADLFNILCIPPYLPGPDGVLTGNVDQGLVAIAASVLRAAPRDAANRSAEPVGHDGGREVGCGRDRVDQ